MTARAPSPVLSPLFAPTSIAVFGASNRPGRPGHQVLAALKKVDPEKTVYPITPRYEEILGYGCAPRLKDVPAVDLAIIASGTDRIEAEVDEAIDCGARSLLIFGAPKADASRAGWLERVGSRASEAGVPLLGPDSLGFVDFVSRTAATWALPDQVRSGAVAVISQSGTVFWEATTNDPRLRFSFTAHSGLESALALDDLIGYALELEATRVIGLYVETVRNPEGFADALAAAAAREVPVVALYAGRTERSRAQMMTHAGRLAGDRASLEGLFRRHGVARVDTNDEWWTTLALLGMHPRLKPGGLAAVMDSGGGLAQFLDFAEELGVPLAALDDERRAGQFDLVWMGGEIVFNQPPQTRAGLGQRFVQHYQDRGSRRRAGQQVGQERVTGIEHAIGKPYLMFVADADGSFDGGHDYLNSHGVVDYSSAISLVN